MTNYRFDNRQTEDPTELKSKLKHVSYFKICRLIFITFLLGCNIVYVQDILFYRNTENGVYYSAIMCIFFVSAVVNMSFSVRIFVMNKENNIGTIIVVTFVFLLINNYYACFKPATSQLISAMFKIMFTHVFTPFYLFLQITTFLRHVFVTKYAIEYKLAERNNNQEDQERFSKLLVGAECDAGLVSVLDCYIRAAPQQVIQLAIIFYNHGDITSVSIMQQISILIAFGVMPWSTMSFQGALRRQQNKKIKWPSKMVYFLWHFSIMGSRIASISGAVAFWPMYTGLFIIVHWFGAALWLWKHTEPTEFCNYSKFWHALFCSVFGNVYVFTPMNLVNKPTFWIHCWFYSICFFENTVMTVVWFISENVIPLEYKIYVVSSNFICFVAGIAFMIWYYKKFHPNRDYLTENEQDCEKMSLDL